MKDSPLAGPELVVNANFRNNWRYVVGMLTVECSCVDRLVLICSASYSWRRRDIFNPYNDDVADYTFSYTSDTWNNPQALWTFAASEVLGVKINGNNGNGKGKGKGQ